MCQAHKVFRNIITLPLTFLNYKHLRYPLMKSKPLSPFHKNTKIPTPFCSLLSIAGTLKFAYLLASSGSTNYFGLYHIQVLAFISIRWKSFYHPCFISHD